MKSTYRILSVFLILAVMTSIVSLAESSNQINQQINKPIVENMDQVTKLIPQAKPSAGFTEDQIQKAREVAVKEQANITNILSKQIKNPNQTVNIDAIVQTVQNGYGIYVLTSPIDSQYYVYKFQLCHGSCYWVYPNLNIPIKIEIWDNNLLPANNNNGWANAYIYYWNYYTNTWTLLYAMGKITNANGQINLGFSIPYKTYSDKYYIRLDSSYWDGRDWFGQWKNIFFTVGWY